MEKFDVLKEELVHVRESLSRVMGTLFTLYGIIIPAFATLMVIYGKDASEAGKPSVIGFIAVALFSAGSAFSNVLWIEAQKYLEYLYVELMPRMYKYSGMESDINFLQYVAKKTTSERALPHLIFNIMSFVGVFSIGAVFIPPDALNGGIVFQLLAVLATLFFVAALVSTYIATKSSIKLKKQLADSFSPLMPADRHI